jgi:ribosomal protein S1
MTNDQMWESVKESLPIGTHVVCRVLEHRPFGVFAMLAALPFDGLIQITDFKDEGPMNPSDYPPVGVELDAVVLGFSDSRTQIWLGTRPSQLGRGHELIE